MALHAIITTRLSLFLFHALSLLIIFPLFSSNNNIPPPPLLGKVYFCKPAKELDKRMAALGALRLLPVCYADDQVIIYVFGFYFD